MKYALFLLSLSAVLSAEDWSSWRGPANTGASVESRLPQTWSPTSNVAWRSSLTGAGVSSPIVSGNQVIVTSQVGSGERRLGPRLGQGAEATEGERSLAVNRASPTVRFLVEAFGRDDGRRLWTYTLDA